MLYQDKGTVQTKVEIKEKGQRLVGVDLRVRRRFLEPSGA